MSDTIDSTAAVDLDSPDTDPATDGVRQTQTPADGVRHTDPTDGVDQTDPTADAPSDADPTEGDEDQGDGPGREAKKYRVRLREAEAQRDALAATVEALQRTAVEQLADKAGIKPAALWAAGTQLADLLADDGTINTEAVTAAVTAARESLGLPNTRRNVVPREGRNPGTPGPGTGIDAMTRVVMGGIEP